MIPKLEKYAQLEKFPKLEGEISKTEEKLSQLKKIFKAIKITSQVRQKFSKL